MRLRTHNWAARAAGRSLAFALFAALLWLGQNRALALNTDGQASPQLGVLGPMIQTLNSQPGWLPPITVVDERPNPLAATAPGASRVLGNQLSLSLNSRSSLASSMYFTRSLPLFEALSGGNGPGRDDTQAGLLALRGPGAEHVLGDSRALQQKLDYSSGGLALRGSYTDVDKDFRAPGGKNVSVIGDRSAMDALAALRGMTDVQYQAQYRPSGAFMLDTSRHRLVNEQPGNSQSGMTVTEVAHALALQLGGGRQLKANFSSRDEDWSGHGAINTEKMSAQLNPSSRLALNYSYDWSDIQRDGNQYKGRDLTDVKQGLVYQLTGRTRLDVNLNQVREAWDRGGATNVTEKDIRDYALHHTFGAATKADLVRNFTSVTTNGATVDADTTQLHLEDGHGRLKLAGDWMGRNLSDGGTEGLAQLALSTVIGTGRSRTSLKGLYKQHSQGQGDKQVDTLYQMALSAAPSPLAQFRASYESLDQQGPQADHAFVRTQLGFGSQLSRHMKLTGDYSRETDKQVQTKADRGLKLDVNRGRLTLTGGVGLQERQDTPDVSTTFGGLQMRLGRGLAEWARTSSGADPLVGASSYGYRGTPGWAALSDGALSLNYIDRSADGAEHVLTRSLAYQTMLGRRVFLKLAQHYNPMVKKDNKDVMEQARDDLYEAGLGLGHGFVALGRSIREEDLKSGSTQQGAVYALRGAMGGGDRFKFTSGIQTLQPEGGAATRWQFTNLNLKVGRPLADWAKAASDVGLFDDNTNYGYRKLPTWAAFGDGGLSLQYMERQPDNAEALIASAISYQAMLGSRSYARLSFQQNPLTDKGQVTPVDRKLYELGRRLGGKLLALARYTTEDGLTDPKYLRSSMLGVRGRLSARERFETVIVLDDVVSPGQHSRTTTYGLEYAREVDDGHYFVLKGTLCGGDAPGGILDGPSTFQVDLAYKKTL